MNDDTVDWVRQTRGRILGRKVCFGYLDCECLWKIIETFIYEVGRIVFTINNPINFIYLLSFALLGGQLAKS